MAQHKTFQKNSSGDVPDTPPTFSDINFKHYFDNKKRSISFRTMVPMCLWVNKTDKLSRIDFPYVDKQTGRSYCDRSEIDDPGADTGELVTDAEKAKWKLYNFWVFNVFNLPPLPTGMSIFQATNKQVPPWNLIGFGNSGILGNEKSLINNAFIWEKGLFTILDQSDNETWRFMTYTQPVPNTKQLYIYETNSWKVQVDKNQIPNPKDILNSNKASVGAATPVGIDQPSQYYITPEPDDDMVISSWGSSYIWVCEREYTQFICPDSIIIPYSPDLYRQGFSKSSLPVGYLTALKQSAQNMQNWVKYKAGSSNKNRSELLALNYQLETNPPVNHILIIFSLIILSTITLTIIYLFKK